MAERKLNFNVPLLSTRRMQNTAVSVRRNKTHNFTDDDDDSNQTNDYSSSVSVLEAGSVPFTWEQAPGRLKGNNDFKPQVCQVFTPCLPPGQESRVQKCKQVEEESENEDDDVFSDARDTLSQRDSFSFKNSISGVSGYGVVETTKKKKKQLKFSEDSQSMDFMLNRFLPAAQAMTVEQQQPHYASNRKPSSFVMSEPTIQRRDLVPQQQTPNRYDESSYYDEESEKDYDEDDEVSEYAYLSKRGCGMLPQFCFKESLSMLNTVPGFKHNSPVTSPSHDQVKSNKVAQLKSRFQSVKKLALDSVSKKKLSGEVKSPVHASVRNKKLNSESNLTGASRSSSPYRHSSCMSPFRSTGETGSPYHSACLLETRKETENLRANRLNKHIRNISRSQELLYGKSNGSTSSLLEKTVYVDTENFGQHDSNVMISPEEEDKAGKKSNADLELEGFQNISIKCGNSGLDRSPLAPPSPKKPSESWLLHNLPSQMPSRRYSFLQQNHDPKENSRNVTKWETIVKTSYMHRDHIRYSEELVDHTSHQ